MRMVQKAVVNVQVACGCGIYIFNIILMCTTKIGGKIFWTPSFFFDIKSSLSLITMYSLWYGVTG